MPGVLDLAGAGNSLVKNRRPRKSREQFLEAHCLKAWVHVTKLKHYVQATNKHFFNIPERSLEQAYQAALRIKSIEDEYFNGNKVITESTSHGIYLASFLRTNFEKNLGVAKLRLAEFRASCFVLGSLGSNHLVKLRLVDEVLAKYNPKEITSSALVPISKVANTNPGKANNQPYSATVDVNAEPLTDKTGALPRSIGRTINKIKKDLNPNSEAEVIRNFRSSRTKTVIAVRFLLTLIIVPFLTQQLSKHYIVSPIVERMRGEH